MKKLLVCLLSLLLCLVSIACAESAILQTYVPDLEPDISENLHATAYYGFWQRDYEFDGAVYRMGAYVPGSYEPFCPAVLVFMPGNISLEEFAAVSGWDKLAEEYGFGVIYFEARDGGEWDVSDPSANCALAKAAFDAFAVREFFDYGEMAVYTVGYGDGATVMNAFLPKYSSMIAGALSMGSADLPAEYLAAVGDEPSFAFAINGDYSIAFDDLKNKDVVLPIWMLTDGADNANLADFWKHANHVVDEGLSNSYGRVFQESRLKMDEDLNDKAISRVWIGEMEGAAECLDRDFSEYAWSQFLSKVRRFTSAPGGALRYGFTAEEVGIEKIELEVEGVTREYLAYVPSSYDGSKAYPLVLDLHGHAVSAFTHAEDTEWWRVAENRDFIVVFGQGSRCTNAVQDATGCSMWHEEDLTYIRAMLADVEERFSVDAARRYVTGHSNGGWMTSFVAENMRDYFAAAVNVGGAFRVSESGALDTANEVKMPYMVIAGQYDLGSMGNYGAEDVGATAHVAQWLTSNGIADAEPVQYDTNAAKHWIYNNEQDIPLTEVMVRAGFHHSYEPEYAVTIWDDFFCKWSRGEDGTSYYCSIAVE